jgi:hypothetical protein
MKNKLQHLFSLLTVIIFIFFAFGSGDNESSSSSSENNKMLAYNYAEDFIAQRLKSPSTAKFPGIFEKNKHISDLGGGKYRINSWVDSQNGFGAMIRSKWSCKIIFVDGKVKAENIIIQ